MHPFDCFAASSSDRRSPSGAGRTLPLSRRASAASHEDLHRLVDQVCAQDCLSLLHVETRRYLCAMCHRAASRMNLTCLIDQAHLKYAQLSVMRNLLCSRVPPCTLQSISLGMSAHMSRFLMAGSCPCSSMGTQWCGLPQRTQPGTGPACAPARQRRGDQWSCGGTAPRWWSAAPAGRLMRTSAHCWKQLYYTTSRYNPCACREFCRQLRAVEHGSRFPAGPGACSTAMLIALPLHTKQMQILTELLICPVQSGIWCLTDSPCAGEAAAGGAAAGAFPGDRERASAGGV